MVETVLTLTPSSAAIGRALAGLAEEASDLREPFGTLAEDLARAQSMRFSSRAEGTWPPLSPGYAERKAAEYPGRPVLERTGRLRADVTRARRTVGPRELVLRVDNRYAALHQRGTRHMPARRIVALTNADRARTLEVVRGHLARVVAQTAARLRGS